MALAISVNWGPIGLYLSQVTMRIVNWSIFAFVAGYHVLLAALFPAFLGELSWSAAALFLVTFGLAGLSITAGYHRLFAHKSYSASPVWEWLCLLSSSLAVQASALQWSHDHRLHHKHVDTDKDPYSIKKGFWYAHVLWLFEYAGIIDPKVVPDLMKNPRVMVHHRHYALITLAVNLAVFGIGCLFVSPLASFVGGVLLRIFAIHHCTWFINSLCHVWGARTYAKELSAVDNAVLALFTFGEGYHNYHHTIAHDYRNGIRWYHFDPTKWLIWIGSKVGLTADLRRVSKVRLQRMLLKKDKELFLDRISKEFDDTAAELKRRFEELSHAYEEKASLLMMKLKEIRHATEERRKLLMLEVKQIQRELKAIWKNWLHLTEFAGRIYAVSH